MKFATASRLATEAAQSLFFYSPRIPSGVLFVILSLVGCSPTADKTTEKTKPAKVEAHPSEKAIYRVQLTKKAESRLQISTVLARKMPVPRVRALGGDVVIPDGKRIPVTAPLAGQLVGIENRPLAAGQSVVAGQPLIQLLPILRPEQEVPGAAERMQMANARASLVTAQIQADGDVQQAQAQVKGAKLAYDRAKKLLSDRAGSQRDVDSTEATYSIARKGLEAATQRKELLDKLMLKAETGKAEAIPIVAPSDGILQTISASAGQVVSNGAALFDIVDLKKLWVRVPVYAGQVAELDLDKTATLRGLSRRDKRTAELKRINAPPTANSMASTVDVYFSLDNSAGDYLPGQRVMVHLPMQGEDESLVVPRAAVLRDINGIAWVYVRSGEQQYERARVVVKFSTPEYAVLSSGPAPKTEVVVDGAAELFGTEFGAGK